MQDSKQIISIIPNWNYIYYMDGSITIPNERMLIELLRPGCDPESVTIQWLAEDEIDKIPDLKSYSIAQKWSNSSIINMCTHPISIENPYGIDETSSLIIQLCSDRELDCREPLYHLAVTRYINLMFPGKLLPNLKNVLAHFQTLNNNFQKKGWDGLSELAEKAETEEFWSDAKSLLGRKYIHSSELEKRFPDYKLANDYLDTFYSCYLYENEDLVLAFLRVIRDRLVNLKQKAKVNIISKQCPFCSKWFDVTKFGNGKINLFCGKPCQTEYERVRKPKERGGDSWQPTAKSFCKQCSKKLLTKDYICNKCSKKFCKQCSKECRVNKDYICKECFKMMRLTESIYYSDRSE
jgi:hypothetical protein